MVPDFLMLLQFTYNLYVIANEADFETFSYSTDFKTSHSNYDYSP